MDESKAFDFLKEIKLITSSSLSRRLKECVIFALIPFFPASSVFAKGKKSYSIPKYSYLSKSGNLVFLGGLSASKYQDTLGLTFGARSKFRYYSEDQFGYFLGSDLSLNSVGVEIMTDDNEVEHLSVKLFHSKAGIFFAVPLTPRISSEFELALGSNLIFGQVPSLSLATMMEVGASLSYQAQLFQFILDFGYSYSEGYIAGQAKNLSRISSAVGMGVKL